MNARPGSSGPAGRKNRHLSGWALAGIVLLLMAVLGAAWVASPRPADPRALVDKRLLVSKGTYVQLASVAPQLREAVVATEDERFWRHHGIDVIGLARAAGYDVSHASLAQGASTITEQLGKDLYLGGDDRTPWRKLEDAALAVRLEAQLSKDQILELYLNEVYFGNGATGVDQASRRYFGVPPARLTLAQASLLGGLIQAPSADDPFIHATAARMRQADVLTSMVRNGYITISEGTGVMRTPMKLAGGRTLPAQPGTSVSPGPQFSLVPLAAGIALGTLAAAAFAAARKSGLGRWWRAGTLAGCLAGLILLARAFNVD